MDFGYAPCKDSRELTLLEDDNRVLGPPALGTICTKLLINPKVYLNTRVVKAFLIWSLVINFTMSEDIDDLVEEAEFEAEEPLGNPAPPPDVDLEKLRGDRIGDTVFSGKWCIQTVMKLMQSNVVIKADVGDTSSDVVDMEEELQNEVGALWDMTSNVQVCQYLHSVGAVESICYLISNSRCPRATEMCVGMLANIIYHNELWDIMKSDKSFFSILIQLLTSTDQPVLLEVNRFFNTALCHQSCEVFYASLNENGQLVMQELLRILSGSTNGDLLKQVAELVYSLMYRDEGDAHFNSRFADPDFVLAVVEASKELGWSHESSGQNYVMEIFHSFTTYEAGVVAIGSALEEVSASGTAYLRTVCQQGLSLATNCQVLTAMLSTLHHIMTRSSNVKDSLLASPSFLHCVLITLVALYRKLGQYHAISGQSHNGRGGKKHQLGTSQTTWQSQEEREEEEAEVARQCGEETSGAASEKGERSPPSGTGRSNNPQGSWSERAFAAARLGGAGSERGTFRTPEASPRAAYKGSGRATRELEVSWSERRLASPLVAEEEEEEESEQWKQPRERRRFKKKEDGAGIKEKRELNKEDVEKDHTKDGTEESLKEELSEQKPLCSPDTQQESQNSESETLDPMSIQNACPLEDSSNTLKAMRIQGQSRSDADSRLSGGFTPSGDTLEADQVKDESKEDEERAATSSTKFEGHEDGGGTLSKEAIPSSSSNTAHTGSKNVPIQSGEKDKDSKDEGIGRIDVGFDFMEKDEDEDLGGEMNKSVSGNSGHKYRMLLLVIRDLLVDYLNSMSQAPAEQDGSAPVCTATIKYLDQQCSGTELRALTRCVRDALGLETSGEHASVEDGRLALQHLLSVCDMFRASHLKSVLMGCMANGSS
ncbi:hypothetical protein RRG08_019258 [Elysia crispata]|uniref:Uncharacterized protein n=1 Tax=Elysia crispata TaxID=231223 RepID=A0AAE1D471_9GAST|nr:hypothetical protein RRG08_019258 [Elysia crispata]